MLLPSRLSSGLCCADLKVLPCCRYAFAITASQLEPPLQIDLHSEFQLQPPWDQDLSVRGKPAYILHFT